MKRIYTAEEMRRAEQNAVNRGSSFEKLMEDAGQGVADNLLKRIADGKLQAPDSILIICGKGNNTGDGLVLARALAEQNLAIKLVFILGSQLSDLSQLNLKRLESLEIDVIEKDTLPALLETFDSSQWIIDAVFGTGFSGELSPEVANIMALANQAQAYRIALDIPTGLNCDTCELSTNTFNADVTYTFAAYKPAHCMDKGKSVSGKIICIDIGI